MKYLVIADSHGYGIASAMERLRKDVTVKTVTVGSTARHVWQQYLEERENLVAYGPDEVFVHMGHNDAVWHVRHNLKPKHPMEILSILLGYVRHLEEDFPGKRIWLSNMFPRVDGPKMAGPDRVDYNLMVYQYGLMMRDVLSTRGVRFVLNRSLWYCPSRGIAHGVYFRSDGLHLSAVGAEAVAEQWLKITHPPLAL
jgi:lysophospholipase L1-like esterase